MKKRTAVVLLSSLLAAACGDDDPTVDAASSGTSDCTVKGQSTFVRDALRDWYYWYKDLPGTDPASFQTPEAYLEAVRKRPEDTTYSYITSKASSEAFFSESQFIGFGLSYRRTGETELRLTQTFPGGPAAEAGMDRGDTLLTIGGQAVADLLRSGTLATALGPEQVGFATDFTWRSIRGGERSARLAKRQVTIPTVSQTAVIESGGARVGYVHFRNFVQPSVAALDTAFAQLREGGATELVLDLRYNGGGLVSVAQHLAGLIAGEATVGKVFLQFTHNDKRTDRNTAYRFEAKPQALGVTRLVVIQTAASASASEAVVNGLRPYMDVKTVGERSYGKPVGQYGFEFCEKMLYPVCFLVANARGEADYFNGIPADCASVDDVDDPLATASEASLGEALHVLRTGRCSGAAAASAEVQARLRTQAPQPRVEAWRELVNAW